MGKILIIDDERAIRRALREILEFEEFHPTLVLGVEGNQECKHQQE